MSDVDIDRAFVIAVGIGSYTIGGDWDLPEAGPHAIAFAAWARRRHVPRANIRLFLAAPDRRERAAEIAAADLDPAKPATNASINGFLDSKQFAALSGDLLYLYWSGHGSVGDDERRLLFFEDLRRDAAPTLDFNYLLTRLRSHPLARFPLQNAYVDACANRFSDLRLEVQPGVNRAGTGGVLPGIDQRIVFAADSGAAALAGRFSRRLLGELEEPSRAGSWPPDFDAIADAITRDVELTGQHPRQFWIRTGDRETTRITGELPASQFVNDAAYASHCTVEWFRGLASIAARLPGFRDGAAKRAALYRSAANAAAPRDRALPAYDDLLETTALAYSKGRENALAERVSKLEPASIEFMIEFERIELLRKARSAIARCNFPREVLVAAYRLAAKSLPRRSMSPDGMTLGAMLYDLSQTDFSDDLHRRRPLFEFVIRLAASAGVTAANAKALRRFAEARAPEGMALDIDRALKAQLRFLLSVAVDEDEGGGFGVEAALMTEDFRLLEVYPERRVDGPKALADAVAGIVVVVRKYLLAQGRLLDDVLDIEFLLPLAQFGLAPEEFPVPLGVERALGDLYPVVVRWRERFENPALFLDEDWKRMAASVVRGARQALTWLPRQQCSRSGRLDDRESVLGLAFVATTEIEDLVRNGAPFVLWPRTRPSVGFVKMRAQVDEWAKDHPTGELRRRLTGLRSAHRTTGKNIAVFWDDPERIYDVKHADVRAGDERG
jgi:hypothetical protein